MPCAPILLARGCPPFPSPPPPGVAMSARFGNAPPEMGSPTPQEHRSGRSPSEHSLGGTARTAPRGAFTPCKKSPFPSGFVSLSHHLNVLDVKSADRGRGGRGGRVGLLLYPLLLLLLVCALCSAPPPLRPEGLRSHPTPPPFVSFPFLFPPFCFWLVFLPPFLRRLRVGSFSA